MNQFSKCGSMALLLLTVNMTTVGLSNAADGGPAQQEFKVGERLPVASTVATTQSSTYRKLSWDDLIPSDWDPMQAIKGLNLAKLKDSDPRAMEAMDKVRAAWDDSPVKPELNGVRIEIPGFVVPLDVNPENLKEFLLVPYFGACIHVPPPPSNQVVHAISPNNLTKEKMKILKNSLQTYGAIVVSGTLETLNSNTAMGFSSYRIKVDRIEPYIEPKNPKRNR